MVSKAAGDKDRREEEAPGAGSRTKDHVIPTLEDLVRLSYPEYAQTRFPTSSLSVKEGSFSAPYSEMKYQDHFSPDCFHRFVLNAHCSENLDFLIDIHRYELLFDEVFHRTGTLLSCKWTRVFPTDRSARGSISSGRRRRSIRPPERPLQNRSPRPSTTSAAISATASSVAPAVAAKGTSTPDLTTPIFNLNETLRNFTLDDMGSVVRPKRTDDPQENVAPEVVLEGLSPRQSPTLGSSGVLQPLDFSTDSLTAKLSASPSPLDNQKFLRRLSQEFAEEAAPSSALTVPPPSDDALHVLGPRLQKIPSGRVPQPRRVSTVAATAQDPGTSWEVAAGRRRSSRSNRRRRRSSARSAGSKGMPGSGRRRSSVLSVPQDASPQLLADLDGQWNALIRNYYQPEAAYELNLPGEVVHSVIVEDTKKRYHEPRHLVKSKKMILSLLRQNVYWEFIRHAETEIEKEQRRESAVKAAVPVARRGAAGVVFTGTDKGVLAPDARLSSVVSTGDKPTGLRRFYHRHQKPHRGRRKSHRTGSNNINNNNARSHLGTLESSSSADSLATSFTQKSVFGLVPRLLKKRSARGEESSTSNSGYRTGPSSGPVSESERSVS